jgi:hypothetical protein
MVTWGSPILGNPHIHIDRRLFVEGFKHLSQGYHFYRPVIFHIYICMYVYIFRYVYIYIYIDMYIYNIIKKKYQRYSRVYKRSSTPASAL